MEVTDQFLNQFVKKNKINFGDEIEDGVKTPIIESKSKIKENLDFDVKSLLNEGKIKRHSILDDINPVITEEDYKHFNDLETVSTKTIANENNIRAIIREELEDFFKSKYVLTESADTEVIYFKVGDTLFKGELKVIK